LAGNIVPARNQRLLLNRNPIHDYQLLGVVVLLTSLVVCVQSFRHRRSVPLAWLPVSIIIIGLVWDASIAVGRVGDGLASGLASHYSNPQVFLFTGIVLFALASAIRHLIPRSGEVPVVGLPARLAGPAFIALLSILIVVLSTIAGESNASFDYRTGELAARTIVNLNRLPVRERSCYLDVSVADGLVPVSEVSAWISLPLHQLIADRLSTFSPPFLFHYRSLGPQKIAECNHDRMKRF
jgi:hypothetical protein